MKNKNNFLQPKHPSGIKKLFKNKYTKWTIISLAILISGLILLFLIYRQPAMRIYQQGISGKDNFLKAQNQLTSQDFENAKVSLSEAINNFNNASNDFNKLRWIKYIPFLGTQVSALDNLLQTGLNAGNAIATVNDLAIDIITPLQKNDDISLNSLSDEETHQLMQNIYEAKPKLEDAKKSIDIAVEKIDAIPEKGLINKIENIITPLKEKSGELQKALDEGISASQIIPSIAGYPDQKTYLFLLQNNTELRPTGGFIGTYGILKVKDGDIKEFNTDNSYNLDKPAEAWLNVEPPWPLTRYNAIHQWYFRDSNWSPDFPTTAQKAEWFYHQEKGPENNIDGIIAVTPSFIQSLLTLTGDIKVNGLSFNSSNLVETLQYQVEQGFLRQGLAESERKEIIGTLSSKILEKVLDLPKSKWPDLWTVISKNIDEKQLLVYIKDSYIENYVNKENWGGKIYETTGDYFSVIDANLASLKTDSTIERSISYSVQKDSNNLIADLTINYNNTGSITWKTTRYRTYTRIYVPLGAKLIMSEGQMVDCKLNDKGSVETLEELNKTVFGTFICIEPGEQKSLHFRYSLPESVRNQLKNGSYSLMVQKQPGTSDYATTINFKLDRKISKVSGVEGIDERPGNDILINTKLSKDLNIITE
ncbi:MAG: DUF4012 domain-containing protein [Patescibacteria group bacterium]